TGDGSVVCVNVQTGEPIFRIPIFKAGINASLLLHNDDEIIAIYGTPYEPGAMVGMKIPHVTPTSPNAPVIVPRDEVELWHNELRTSASSPILVGDRVYLTSEIGYLVSVDAASGKMLWKLKLGTEQRNSCPLFADGKIYAPILNDPSLSSEVSEESANGGHGALYVVRPTDSDGAVVSRTTLDGRCYGTPTAYNGRIYIQTTKKFYCFGDAKPASATFETADAAPEVKMPAAGPAKSLLVIPCEVLLQPNETVSFRVRELDANGLTAKEIEDPKSVKWASFIPPTAKVKARMNATFNADGQLVAGAEKVPSAGAFEGEADDLKGYIRGRVLPGLPIMQDFESFKLTAMTTNAAEPPTAFAYPPLPWIGARFKFDVREKDGSKCLVKTIDNPFFQRATVFMGSPELKNYTIQAEVMSEGNKRKMSTVGVINQRYRISLKGNEQVLEITSNEELMHVIAPFHWVANEWYLLKARVDVAADGSGVIRGKAWKKGDAEPDAWTCEAPVPHANIQGSPGLFGFSPQNMRIFIDNIAVTAD
ncbi:MAG TPA: PQQ-binding-like beta-propeller repeat protein, partial [Verrucomicrobiae bacterium]|nr:PQQ-binding-like beta-propeller repeat protein [Verrucomicrobiae bacterium]